MLQVSHPWAALGSPGHPLSWKHRQSWAYCGPRAKESAGFLVSESIAYQNLSIPASVINQVLGCTHLQVCPPAHCPEQAHGAPCTF